MNNVEIVCGSKWLAASNLVLEVTCVRESYVCYDILGMNCSSSAETEFFLKQCKPLDDEFIQILEEELSIEFKEDYVKDLALEYKDQLVEDVFDALMKWKVNGDNNV